MPITKQKKNYVPSKLVILFCTPLYYYVKYFTYLLPILLASLLAFLVFQHPPFTKLSALQITALTLLPALLFNTFSLYLCSLTKVVRYNNIYSNILFTSQTNYNNIQKPTLSIQLSIALQNSVTLIHPALVYLFILFCYYPFHLVEYSIIKSYTVLKDLKLPFNLRVLSDLSIHNILFYNLLITALSTYSAYIIFGFSSIPFDSPTAKFIGICNFLLLILIPLPQFLTTSILHCFNPRYFHKLLEWDNFPNILLKNTLQSSTSIIEQSFSDFYAPHHSSANTQDIDSLRVTLHSTFAYSFRHKNNPRKVNSSVFLTTTKYNLILYLNLISSYYKITSSSNLHSLNSASLLVHDLLSESK